MSGATRIVVMRFTSAPIYYISRDLIDQIYRKQFGPIEETIVSNQSEKSRGWGGKLGLSKVLSIFGLDAGGETKSERKKSKSESRSIKQSSHDRALVLLEKICANNPANVRDIVTHDEYHDIYTFSAAVHLSYTPIECVKSPLVEVSYESEGLQFSGLTSADNWTSPSLMNNLLWKSKKSKDAGIWASGILTPLFVERAEEGINLSVQYLVIFHPSMLQSAL
jgi:hypothetical protein